VFSDAAIIGAMLRFESALARAQAKLGLIPAAAAATIAAGTTNFTVDSAQLARDGAHAGSLAIPFVHALTQHIARTGAQAAQYVHRGATSQDVLDSALVLCTRVALEQLDAQLTRGCDAARALAMRHERTPTLARTLMQPAGVTTFGLKAARWALSMHRGRERLRAGACDALAVALGGGAGDLAAFGDHGPALRAALAVELDLADPGASWHAQRESWIALAADAALAAGSLSKIANDIALMAQFEVGEVAEPHAPLPQCGASTAVPQRGGSTAMPHKRNPVLCLRVLAATQPVPHLIAQLLAAMKQEHERALGHWQAEIAAWPRVFTHTFSAAQALAELLEGLQVDAPRCQANIDALRGVLYADRLAHLFASAIPKLEAHELVATLAHRALDEQRNLCALAKQHVAGDARFSRIGVAEIEGCFAQEAAVAVAARETQSMLRALKP
jgi:3-carboxy-cis,cis-muconate cycloisomerase